MRVRISFDALRLCLLVAAGVTSGYLWRAAFEASSPAEQRVAATPRIVHPAPAPPTVRIVPHRRSPRLTRVARRRVVAHTLVHGTPASSKPLASQPVAAPAPATTPVSTPTPSKPEPKPAPQPAPKPTPKPTPSPPPPTTTTPPPSTTTPQSVAAPPVQQPSTSPPATTPPPVQQPADDGSRPGWGNGDKNHDHTGPGGGKPN
jgi:hypothetical protein